MRARPQPNLPPHYMSESRIALNIDSVAKRYGSTTALRGVSFEIARGEFFGLLGPNGAGKSTLISIIAGLVRADAGQVAVQEHREQAANLHVPWHADRHRESESPVIDGGRSGLRSSGQVTPGQPGRP